MLLAITEVVPIPKPIEIEIYIQLPDLQFANEYRVLNEIIPFEEIKYLSINDLISLKNARKKLILVGI